MGWLRYLLERWRTRGLPAGRYELRYTYDPHTTLGDAGVRSRHVQLHDAAEGGFTRIRTPRPDTQQRDERRGSTALPRTFQL